MVSFQLKLNKDKKGGPKGVSKPFGFTKTSDQSAKNGAIKPVKKNVLDSSDSDSEGEDRVVKIDSFDKKNGAGDNKKNSSNKDVPIIRQEYLKSSIRDVIKRQGDEHENSKKIELDDQSEQSNKSLSNRSRLEKEARRSLLSGEDLTTDSGETIHILKDALLKLDAALEIEASEYKSMPVENFGAALLRGMGWKQNRNRVKTPDLEKRKRGATLGIGAQAVEDELMTEIQGKDKTFLVPMTRRDKRIGYRGNEQRDRSPSRQNRSSK